MNNGKHKYITLFIRIKKNCILSNLEKIGIINYGFSVDLPSQKKLKYSSTISDKIKKSVKNI